MNAIKKANGSSDSEISYVPGNFISSTPVWLLSRIPYFLLISIGSQINAALLSAASVSICIEISVAGLIRIASSTPFKGTHLLTQLASLLNSLFSLFSFLFHPVSRYHRQFPHHHTTPYCPNPTNQLSLV